MKSIIRCSQMIELKDVSLIVKTHVNRHIHLYVGENYYANTAFIGIIS